MKKTTAVIIPTLNKFDECLKPCLDSIAQHTDDSVLTVVVANGCDADFWIKFNSYQRRNVVQIDRRETGYTAAVNEGIRWVFKEQPDIENFVFLNNDTVIHGDDWVKLLLEPLKRPEVGLTGPVKQVNEFCGEEFIIFFCAATRKDVLRKLAIPGVSKVVSDGTLCSVSEVTWLDEAFNPGFGEDIDFSARVKRAGYQLVQVPEGSINSREGNNSIGAFPIYHEGHKTFKEFEGKDAAWDKHIRLLRERYGRPVTIDRAMAIDGFVSAEELTWLSDQAKCKEMVIEVGSWFGRSAAAISDQCKRLIAVDHWNGSKFEKHNHACADWKNGDFAYLRFFKELSDRILSGKILPIRVDSCNGVEAVQSLGVKADMIFIDGGHSYHEVVRDILAWKPLLKEGGLFCGHDYMQGLAPEVTTAVRNIYPKVKCAPNTTIWYVDDESPRDYVIYDCFTVNNELDLVEIRLEELFNTVDRFVIIESGMTFTGAPKPFYFEQAAERFKKYAPKIDYIKIPSFPVEGFWDRERYQRDYIRTHLMHQCHMKDRDLAIISDVDEIPRAFAVAELGNGLYDAIGLEQDLFYYNCHWRCATKWNHARAVRGSVLRQETPTNLRYMPLPAFPKGGWHLSYFGGPEAIAKKISESAHQEYNVPKFKDLAWIENCIKTGHDIFDRSDIKYEWCDKGTEASNFPLMMQ